MTTTDRRGRGRARGLVGLLTAAALVAGCTPGADRAGSSSPDGTSTSAAGATTSADAGGATSAPVLPSGDTGSATSQGDVAAATTGGGSAAGAPAGLESFYSQQLTWTSCEGGDFQCATLKVPMDYAHPTGRVLDLALLKAPATGQRRGSLVVNPGGPGGSGVDYAKMADQAVGTPVRQAYDVVGFDPRGVGRSTAVDCLDDAQLDAFLGADPSPDDPAEEKATKTEMRAFGAACQQRSGELLAHVSTPEAARDMDVLRAALGEQTLTYLGASYGTYLGATYAALFPQRVGRFVLDGAVDPKLTSLQMGLGQAQGFEQATREYVKSCVADGDCPLGADVDSAMKRIPQLLEELDRNPIKVDGDTITRLGEGWGMLGIVVAMYDQAGWPVLTQALRRAEDGDGSMLMFLANLYASRNSDGTYQNNGMEAIYAVNCLDRPAGSQDLDTPQVRAEFEKVAPTWGRYLAGDGACDGWPVTAEEQVTDFSARGAAPIVVIGTTRDPATPHAWAVSLAKELSSGVLISYDGDGHTAYGRSNACVDDAVNAYLVDGTVPRDGLSC